MVNVYPFYAEHVRVITFLCSSQVIRHTINKNFENLKRDRPYRAIHFHSSLLSGPFSWLRKLKNAYLELLSFFMTGRLLRDPAQPRFSTFQNGLVTTPPNTRVCDDTAGEPSPKPFWSLNRDIFWNFPKLTIWHTHFLGAVIHQMYGGRNVVSIWISPSSSLSSFYSTSWLLPSLFMYN